MRWFLLTSLLLDAAYAIYSVDLNLYLAAAAASPATIGVVASVAWLASLLVSIPTAHAISRHGYRPVAVIGVSAAAAGCLGLLVLPGVAGATLAAAGFGIGNGMFAVAQGPFMADRASPARRTALFSFQFALANAAALIAIALGALLLHGEGPQPEEYRPLLVLMTAFAIVAAISTLRWPRGANPTPSNPWHLRAVLRTRGLMRLAIPWMLVMFGAGQLMPFVNLFLQVRFSLTVSDVNLVFAVAQAGTVAALLIQPPVIRRIGTAAGVAGLQSASIPFLLIIGFFPGFGVVAGAMVLRNALMTAANPLFFLHSMEVVEPAFRPTIAAALSLLGSLAFVLGGWWYSVLQQLVGFNAGYSIGFATVSVLYAAGALIFWTWSRRAAIVRL